MNKSDHNSIITKFNFKWKEKVNGSKLEIFNFNDKEGQLKFKEMTSNNTKLSDIFKSEEDVNTQTKKFLKKLKGVIHQCFKKVKVQPAHNSEIDKLLKTEKELKSKSDQDSKIQLKQVQSELAEKMCEDMYKIVKEEVEKVDCDSGGFNSGHLWKLKSKLRPKFNDYPTAMMAILLHLKKPLRKLQLITLRRYWRTDQ